jgi:hypothetical protein
MLFKNSSVDRSEPKRHATRFRFWLIVISLIVSVVVLIVVVAIAIQHHNDRLLSAQLIQSEVELQTTGARIVGDRSAVTTIHKAPREVLLAMTEHFLR